MSAKPTSLARPPLRHMQPPLRNLAIASTAVTLAAALVLAVAELAIAARSIKLMAGDMIRYPTTTLHRVEPGMRGERLAVLGWVQSLIRHGEQRGILFDLEQAVEAAFAAAGKSALFDRLARTRSNPLRIWAEI